MERLTSIAASSSALSFLHLLNFEYAVAPRATIPTCRLLSSCNCSLACKTVEEKRRWSFAQSELIGAV